MPIVQYVQADLFEHFNKKEFDALVHGCNCWHSFGKGFALTLKKKYPEAYDADKATLKGSRKKLGTYSSVETSSGTIINAYTQFHYGYGKVNADYSAIKQVFERINLDFKNQKVAIPDMIGCGLAGGNRDIVIKIINEATPDVEIVAFHLPQK